MNVRMNPGQGPAGEKTVRITAQVCAGVTIDVPPELVRAALEKAWAMRQQGRKDHVSGFFDVLNDGLNEIKKIADIPLVRTVANAIPYGGTVMTALDLATAASAVGRKALGHMPAPVTKLGAGVVKNDPAAVKALATLKKQAAHPKTPPAIRQNSRRALAGIGRYIQITHDLDALQGYTPAAAFEEIPGGFDDVPNAVEGWY